MQNGCLNYCNKVPSFMGIMHAELLEVHKPRKPQTQKSQNPQILNTKFKAQEPWGFGVLKVVLSGLG